jgi:site-specific recombinase XerD
MKIGLRTGEICSLRIENINFKNKTFFVLDSKRKRLYPLPLDVLTLQLIRDLIGSRNEGFVFTRELRSRSWSHVKTDKPLHVATVEKRLEKIGLQAGVKSFTPRLLRHYFAVEWHRAGKSLELLRRILRHKSLAYTQFYLAKLICFEDIQSEYESFQNGPLNLQLQSAWMDKTESLASKICSRCEKLPICKFADQMPSWATGCQYFTENLKLQQKIAAP